MALLRCIEGRSLDMVESSQTLTPDSVLKIVCLSLTPCLPSTNSSEEATLSP